MIVTFKEATCNCNANNILVKGLKDFQNYINAI